MPSRMEKYYQTKSNVPRRTSKNQSLYNDIYSNNDYNVDKISNANEISPEKLNEILNQSKKPQKRIERNYVSVDDTDLDDEKKYDINEVLAKAKSQSINNNYNYDKLKIERETLLKKIENYKVSKQEQDESLNDLLNTIASTKMLSNINDKDLSLDLLNDLKSNNDNTVVGGISSIDKVLNDVPKKNIPVDEDGIDKSFYTSSMNFNEDDFDELNSLKKSVKKNNLLIKILVIALSLIALIVLVLIIFSLKK